MKLLITPINERHQSKAQVMNEDALEHLFNSLRTVTTVKNSQAIELTDKQTIHRQIESAVDKIDITTLLSPTMLNTGGMEVLAKLKQDLTTDIEATLLARPH